METESGEHAFKVDGKAVRFRDTLVLETAARDELYKIQEKKLSVRDKMEKRCFRIRDTCGIEIAPEEDAALTLAATVCTDWMGRE
jgi:uncharacterized protein YxjI